ncbi:hypothetical protein [Methylopila turkensis]|uniref:Uncharacterized protein n=1 Tax=Methylopila turkensis TaxID=1437816 RepID=A0A9W6N7D6_9HYPH|nr:hypothetical protein [Methylopila turkensis]GLK80292.1 hypothetical protein GCM10008174_20330 [Methylopila turkensis]
MSESHKYKIGQRLELSPSSVGRSGGVVEIVRLLPAMRDDLEPQYRVKSHAESHERVVQESMLSLAAARAG